MEPIGAISEREWISLSGTYTAEESDFMANLLNNYCLPNELNSDLSLEIPSAYWAAANEPPSLTMAAMDEPSYYSSDASDSSNLYGLPQGNNNNHHYTLSDSHPLWLPNGTSLSLDFSMEDVGKADSARFDDNGSSRKTRQCRLQQSPADPVAVAVVDGKSSQLKRKPEVTAEEEAMGDEKVSPMSVDENSKKRSHSSLDVEKSKRSTKTRKIPKLALPSCNEEDHIISPNGQCTSSFSSEDDCNEAQEINGGITSSSNSKGSATLTSNGKPRASRGSATDPQSLYARKRRERINERLRILQSLVPNGTKVDISTMLEEAVQYVKFLQLQIKLLSSDDLWMYAPIAYNGMDIGLNLKLMKQDNASQ